MRNIRSSVWHSCTGLINIKWPANPGHDLISFLCTNLSVHPLPSPLPPLRRPRLCAGYHQTPDDNSSQSQWVSSSFLTWSITFKNRLSQMLKSICQMTSSQCFGYMFQLNAVVFTITSAMKLGKSHPSLLAESTYFCYSSAAGIQFSGRIDDIDVC